MAFTWGKKISPVSTARQLLSIDRIIGCSTKTIAAALQAQTDGVDYVAVGSMYPTASKTDTYVVGLETLRQIREAISIPIVAIGGIDDEKCRRGDGGVGQTLLPLSAPCWGQRM